MSESGYNVLDLDDPGKTPADPDLEIQHEELEAEATPETVPEEPVAPRREPPPSRTEDDSDDDNIGDEAAERKRLSRSQRLKNQRDAYANQLAETQQRLADAEARASRYERDAAEGASIGMDFYMKSLDANLQALRKEFDAAFDAGDRDKIFDVQTKIATLSAEREQARRDKMSIPTPAARTPPGTEVPPQTQRTPQATTPQAGPSPAAMEWYERNKDWFNKDRVATAVAREVDLQMVNEGYQPSDPDYFEELDKRLRSEMPNKFREGGEVKPKAAAQSPTVQNRSAPQPATGKIRVVITQADRDMARQLGLPIETYAREKARREQAQNTATQYTEIL